MCGIIGYVGYRSALPVLFDGLKRLEYRGYDSAGIAFRNGKGIEIYKTKGKIAELEHIVPSPAPEANIGIGHTRWATHGEPSAVNAHPHRSDGVVVVHNGIIENYRALKADLAASGRQFSSDTDTEVIPHLISENMEKGLTLQEAIEDTISRLRGSFALGIMSDKFPDTLFAVKKGSPLVIGCGNGEFFFASDIPAMLPYTKKFIFLEDRQICSLKSGSLDLSLSGRAERVAHEDSAVEVSWSPSMAEKNGFSHFMLKEIHEQPDAVLHTAREWDSSFERISEEINLTAKNAFGLRGLHIVACGSSFHAALVGKYIIESIVHIPVYVEIASEYRYREPMIEHDHLYVFITQSGETADTLAAQREAKSKGARTLSVCNVVGSASSREADCVLHTRAGPEIGVAATKTFTSQIAALCILACWLGIKKGRLNTKEAAAFQSQLMKMPELMDKILKHDQQIQDLASSLAGAKDALYMARGINYPIALEGALKLKEISYIHAEGYPGGEMKHGPIALIEQGLPVIVIAPLDLHFEKIFSNIKEVKARNGKILVVTDEAKHFFNEVDDIIEVPSTNPLLSPFINVIPLQLLAYYTGIRRGYDVDQPRNLAKCVTVE